MSFVQRLFSGFLFVLTFGCLEGVSTASCGSVEYFSSSIKVSVKEDSFFIPTGWNKEDRSSGILYYSKSSVSDSLFQQVYNRLHDVYPELIPPENVFGIVLFSAIDSFSTSSALLSIGENTRRISVYHTIKKKAFQTLYYVNGDVLEAVLDRQFKVQGIISNTLELLLYEDNKPLVLNSFHSIVNEDVYISDEIEWQHEEFLEKPIK